MELKRKFDNWRTKLSSQLIWEEDYYTTRKRNRELFKNKQWVSVEGNRIVDLSEDERLKDSILFYPRSTRLPNDIQVVLATYLSTPINPQVLPVSISDEDREKAEYTQKLLRGIFYELGWINGVKLVNALVKWVTYGTLGIYVGYKRHGALVIDGKKQPRVKFTIDPLSPFEFVIDPTIEDNRDLFECFLIKKVPKEWLYKNFKIESDDVLEGINKQDDETVILEYFSIEGDKTESKHVYMTISGDILFEEKNPYGDMLPLVVVPYYVMPDTLYGLSPIDLAAPVQSYINLMWSIILTSMFKGIPSIVAPKGMLMDEEWVPGGVIEYNPMVAGGRVDVIRTDAISPSWIQAVQLFMQEQQDKMHISEVNYGRARASDSGKKVQILAAQTEFVKIPQFIPFQHGLTLVAQKVLQDIKNDPYGYWSTQKIVRYIGDDQSIGILPFDKKKISDGDVVVQYGGGLPITKPQMMEQLLINAFERIKSDPSDEEAKKTLQHFYAMVGLDGLMGANDVDRKQAERENKRIKEFAEKLMQVSEGEAADLLEEVADKIEVYPFQDHKTHIEVHSYLAKTEFFEEMPVTARQLLIEHINKHYQMMGGAWSIPGSPINQMAQRVIQSQNQNIGGENNEMG